MRGGGLPLAAMRSHAPPPPLQGPAPQRPDHQENFKAGILLSPAAWRFPLRAPAREIPELTPKRWRPPRRQARHAGREPGERESQQSGTTTPSERRGTSCRFDFSWERIDQERVGGWPARLRAFSCGKGSGGREESAGGQEISHWGICHAEPEENPKTEPSLATFQPLPRRHYESWTY